MSRPKLAVIMDPIESIDPAKDSTLAMLLAAQERDWQICYGGLNDIWLRDGVAFGGLRPLRVANDPKCWFELDEPKEIALGIMDVILMRKDPPFNMEYVYATQPFTGRCEHNEDYAALDAASDLPDCGSNDGDV
jgi:glutathione synthase